MKTKNHSRLRSINPEWWLLLSLFCVSLAVMLIPYGERMLLFLYLAPIMIAAFTYGRRHAILTSIACVLLVIVGTVCRDVSQGAVATLSNEKWGELGIWSVMVLGFGWGLGWLFGDVRQANEGFMDIMRYMVGRDNERHNYVRRLSYVAGAIAQEAALSPTQCETIRRAALLRDIGELNLSRDTFNRFFAMCAEDDKTQGTDAVESHVNLSDVMSLVLANRLHGVKFDRQPVGARILAVAAEYDDLTSTKKRRTALPPSVARMMIEREAGKKFDAIVVRAFSRACDHGAFSTSQRFAVAAGE